MPRVVPPGSRVTRPDWRPRFDFGEQNPGVVVSGEDAGEGWADAPATSHVHSFRYIDLSDDANRLLRKFPTARGRGRSELHVRFKDEKTGGVAATYAYYFESPAAGAEVFRKMRESPRPFRDVVKAVLIDGRIPYNPISDY